MRMACMKASLVILKKLNENSLTESGSLDENRI
jgi:hypothetical protein